MTKNAFTKFVAYEEKRLNQICSQETDDFLLKKMLILRDLALEFLKALDMSDKADRLKSMLMRKSDYRSCGVNISMEYSWNELSIRLVTGTGIDDLIRIESDVDDNGERYWYLIDKENYLNFPDIDALVQYLENYKL